MEIRFSGTGYSSSISINSFFAGKENRILEPAKDVIYNCNKNRNEDKSPLRDMPYNQDNFDWVLRISDEYNLKGKRMLLFAYSKEIEQMMGLPLSRISAIRLDSSEEEAKQKAENFTSADNEAGIIYIPPAGNEKAFSILERLAKLDSNTFVFSENFSERIKSFESKKIVLKKIRLFSPLGLPGLLAGAFSGIDIDQLLSGARRIDSFLGREYPQKNPAAIFASKIFHSNPEKNGVKFECKNDSLKGICKMCNAMMENYINCSGTEALSVSFGIKEPGQSDINLVIDELTEYKLGMLIYFLQTASTMLGEFSNLRRDL
ncbi:hypothetical protein [Sedimentisphaera salicampi]|uniref:Glucose-6-phosphate isomerase n=1 Tax=Sedimentisphaera salicampi TaxID=1941349 RepID=A0A1W6LK00_9BACT|nr:hypothetical protein [Sedimentisphaera salicampi]ARN56085.1 glucose-6-phosphate isomerase [Sedimentisphaera salicampi]OXU15817.1 glucose-6-phosphate isomerase [Sedimentisphaera salicampi]